MKNKIKNEKKFKKIVIFAICLIIIEIISLVLIKIYVFDKNSENYLEIKTSNYELKYSSEWKKSNVNDEGFILKNKNAQLLLEIIKLEENDRYKKIEELHDEVIYNINSDNKEYSFLSEEKKNITKNKYDGYQLLYETEKNNLILKLFKDYDNIYIITYEAPINEFDFFLENVENIIDSLTITKDVINSNLDYNLEFSNLEFDKNEKLDNGISSTEEHTISSNNYSVKFKIPSNFKTNRFDSKMYIGNFEGLNSGESLNIKLSIYNSNLFSVLDKNNFFNIYASETYRNKEDFYEQLSKISEKKYIYKYFYNKENEVIKIVYEIDKNHICIVELDSKKTGITQKMINFIDIVNYENYAQNIEKTNTLKASNISNNIVQEVKFNIPDKYIQIDKDNNIYESRNYVLNKNENNLYDYEIEIKIINSDPEYVIQNVNNSIKSELGIYNEMKKNVNEQYNGKEFEVYEGGKTLLSGTLFTNKNREKYYQNKTILFYKLAEKQYIEITINGNEKEITKEVINDFTNFN